MVSIIHIIINLISINYNFYILKELINNCLIIGKLENLYDFLENSLL